MVEILPDVLVLSTSYNEIKRYALIEKHGTIFDTTIRANDLSESIVITRFSLFSMNSSARKLRMLFLLVLLNVCITLLIKRIKRILHQRFINQSAKADIKNPRSARYRALNKKMIRK